MLTTSLRQLHRVLRDRRGVALLEFALALPIILPLGMYGIELGNYGIRQIQFSQAVSVLADNASRVGADTTLATQRLREIDINEVIQGLRLQTNKFALTTNGRVTISSLEVKDGRQWIHWQRCVGLKKGSGYDSSYGVEGNYDPSFVGVGDSGTSIKVPSGSAVIVVEANADYVPILSTFFLGSRKMHEVASFIVRDNRELSVGVTNPSPAASEIMSCNRYTT